MIAFWRPQLKWSTSRWVCGSWKMSAKRLSPDLLRTASVIGCELRSLSAELRDARLTLRSHPDPPRLLFVARSSWLWLMRTPFWFRGEGVDLPLAGGNPRKPRADVALCLVLKSSCVDIEDISPDLLVRSAAESVEVRDPWLPVLFRFSSSAPTCGLSCVSPTSSARFSSDPVWSSDRTSSGQPASSQTSSPGSSRRSSRFSSTKVAEPLRTLRNRFAESSLLVSVPIATDSVCAPVHVLGSAESSSRRDVEVQLSFAGVA